MKILPIQDVYMRKFERQKKIDKLQYHAAGHCVHIGKISPGCYSCFVPNKYSKNIQSGFNCNLNCVYCASGACRSSVDKKEKALNSLRFEMDSRALKREVSMPGYNPSKISFSGGGEPLMYLDNISLYMNLFHDIHKSLKDKPWYFLYTNGILATEKNLERLNALGFDEIRFHLGATHFSEKVYGNMRKAVTYFKAVSVETPAWPFHKKKLFQMLPRIQDIGVKHLNITEIEINQKNFNKISKALPDGEICQCGELQLYDNGLVYDLMEEVIKKKYTFSVLDCNCFVKSIQRTPGKWVLYEAVDGLCAV
jgi:pyruvate formate-lyase activating enzyme-like uncharacterized protein